MKFFVFATLSLSLIVSSIKGSSETNTFFLSSEPLIRIGLITNASSVHITTGDTQLVAYAPDETPKMLAANRVTVSARAYRPPVVEQYIIEVKNIATSAEAAAIAERV